MAPRSRNLMATLFAVLVLASCDGKLPSGGVSAPGGSEVARLTGSPAPAPSSSHNAPLASTTCEVTSGVSPLAQARFRPDFTHEAVALAGLESIAGLDVSKHGERLTPLVAKLKVRACPGAGQAELDGAHVNFFWTLKQDSPAIGAPVSETLGLDVGAIPIDPVIVPPAPAGGGYGAPESVDVPLPLAALNAALSPLSQDDYPAAVVAQVTFQDEYGFDALDGVGTVFTVSFDLPTGSDFSTPSLVEPSPCPGLPGPIAPARIFNGDNPPVADLLAFQPSGGLTVSTADPVTTPVTISLHVPPYYSEVAIASESLSFTWTDSAGHSHAVAAAGFTKALKVQAGLDRAFGPDSTLTLPIDTSPLAQATHQFADLLATGFAIAHLQFKEVEGKQILNGKLQPLDVEIPILVQ